MSTNQDDKLKGVIEVDGYEIAVDASPLDDVEMLPKLAELRNGEDIGLIKELLVLILGEDGYKKTYDHFKAERGRLPLSVASDIIEKTTELINPKG